MNRILSVLVICLSTVFLSGCGESQPSKLADGKPAPDFTLPDVNDKDVKLSDLKGKSVVLYFFSDWCSFCEGELTEIEAIYKERKEQGLAVLAVNVGQHKKSASDYVNRLGVTFPTLVDKYTQVSQTYAVNEVPVAYFIDTKGVIVGKIKSKAEKGMIAALIKKAMP